MPALRKIARSRGLHVEEMVCPVCGCGKPLYAVSSVPETGGCQFASTGSSLEEAYTKLLDLLDQPLPRSRASAVAYC